jgi:hypothetical protein
MTEGEAPQSVNMSDSGNSQHFLQETQIILQAAVVRWVCG